MKKIEGFLRKLSFNIRRDKELELNRRGFIASSLSLMGVLFVSSTPLLALSKSREEEAHDSEVFIINEKDIAIGESFSFSYPDENDSAILVRISEKEYRAYNSKCTHLMCPVYWEKDTGKLTCPCHNGFSYIR